MTNDDNRKSDDHGPGAGIPGNDRTIRVEVATPNGIYRAEYPKTTKVQKVIADAVKDRHLDGGDAYELWYGKIPLTPVDRPLGSFNLPSKVKLSLVATGSGV